MDLSPAAGSSSSPYFERRTCGPLELIRLMADIVRSSPDLRGRGDETPIDHAFLERVMLAVSQVNACRYCLYGHTQAALGAGVPRDEIAALLGGSLADSPSGQAVALAYAQHYAATRGAPDAEAQERLANEYGQIGAARIQAAIHMITLGNLLGNTFDAVVSRLRGRPARQGSLLSELSALALAVLGVIPLGILMALRILLSRRAKPAIQPVPETD
jgi:AhpD family alkylhydroperoxidase